jgi:hypothetical protein
LFYRESGNATGRKTHACDQKHAVFNMEMPRNSIEHHHGIPRHALHHSLCSSYSSFAFHRRRHSTDSGTGQPFDIVKVRLQTTSQYTSALDAATKIYKNEGPLAFYKGTLTPLIGIGACVRPLHPPCAFPSSHSLTYQGLCPIRRIPLRAPCL